MRILIALLFSCALIPLSSCGAGPCDFGQSCWVTNYNNQTIEVHGTVEFTDDDRDVKSLSPGGFVRIREGNWLDPDRVYQVKADLSGHLTREYIVDGEPRSIGSSAQAWVASTMLLLIRESGINAPQRVQRILRNGGPNAVLAEVAEIGSDGSKRTYLRELIEHGRLTDDQLRDAMRSTRKIGSDGDKSGLLVDVIDSYLRPNLREAWFTTAGTISSDGDRRRALEHALRADPGNPETLALAARAAAGISSDGDKSAVLTEIAGDYKPDTRQAWFRAANTIGSDGDRSHALSSLLKVANADPETMVDLFDSARGIGSDGDKARVLSEAAQYTLNTAPEQHAFFAAVNSIGSDGDRGQTLQAVLRSPNRSGPLLAGVAEAAGHIGSDGDKAHVLSRLAEMSVDDAGLRQSFFAAVNTIGSDGDRAAVLTNVLRQPDAPVGTVVAVIESAVSIGSDGDKASILVLAADTHAANPAVRAALQKALESVHSDGDYRRVSSALIRKTS